MIPSMTRSEIVVLLGRGPLPGDPVSLIERAAAEGADVRVLSIGLRATKSQQAYVEEAVDRAFRARVAMDAQLVADRKAALAMVGACGDVVIVARGRRGKRIESGLKRTGR